MSLDIYLESDTETVPAGSGIFVRRNGATVEITEEEWEDLYPDREPVRVIREEETTKTVYHGNITHNLAEMAHQAGIFEYLWRAPENGVERAEQLIEPLAKALLDLKNRTAFYKQFDSPNGWGTYGDFVDFVDQLLRACREHPTARVGIWA